MSRATSTAACDISRKQFLRLSAGALAGAWASARTAHGQQAAGRPKNVLLLMSDQHKPGALGVAGDNVARTPNLDGLAREGMRFASAYCSNPVCVPARASLLTGLYTHNHKAYNNRTPWPFEIKTIAHTFARAGYMTGLIGKMHFVDAQTHGFDYRLDFNDWFQYLGPKTRLYADELARPNSGSGLPQIDDLWEEGDPWKGTRENDGRAGAVHVGRVSRLAEQDHFDSFVTRESVRFLRRHGRRRPFFLVSSFLKPHDPFMPAERFARMFRPEQMKLPPTWGKVNLATVPEEIRQVIAQNRPTPELADPEKAHSRIALYYANLAQMDDCVGKVLQALRELDLEKDTVVLYTADHGEMLGEHGLWQKFVFYESSMGVPLIVRVPGLAQRGARSASPVSHVQVFPTLCELCDLEPPARLDGPSFARNLSRPEEIRNAPVFAEFNLRTPRAKYMIRHGDFKLCHYVSDTPELYNLRDDPEEMKNLAFDPAHAAKLEALRAELFAWYRPPEKPAG